MVENEAKPLMGRSIPKCERMTDGGSDKSAIVRQDERAGDAWSARNCPL